MLYMEENIDINREMIHSRLVHFVRGMKHSYTTVKSFMDDHSLKLGNDIPVFFSTFCLAVKRAIGIEIFLG